jgi:predicted hydrocarbon binding protein
MFMEAVESRVCFNPRGFKALLTVLQDTYKSAGSAMIFQMSQRYAEYLMSELYPLSEQEYDDLFGAIGKRFRHVKNLGWGEFKVTRFDLEKGVVIIQGKSSYPILSCAGVDDPMCLFIKGALVGAVSRILNRDFEVHVEDCVEYEDGVECLYKLTTDDFTSV